jgi:hypothetical protein
MSLNQSRGDEPVSARALGSISGQAGLSSFGTVALKGG